MSKSKYLLIRLVYRQIFIIIFLMKTHVVLNKDASHSVGDHEESFCEALLVSTNNMCLQEEEEEEEEEENKKKKKNKTKKKKQKKKKKQTTRASQWRPIAYPRASAIAYLPAHQNSKCECVPPVLIHRAMTFDSFQILALKA